jgi:hypothetical protein
MDMELRLFNLVRFTDSEIVFSSSQDLRDAYEILKKEDNILISYVEKKKRITKILGPEILGDVRSKSVLLSAEEEI